MLFAHPSKYYLKSVFRKVSSRSEKDIYPGMYYIFSYKFFPYCTGNQSPRVEARRGV